MMMMISWRFFVCFIIHEREGVQRLVSLFLLFPLLSVGEGAKAHFAFSMICVFFPDGNEAWQ